MSTYNIINKKYNVNFDLKLDSFHIFIQSLKESKNIIMIIVNWKILILMILIMNI